ncbi:MAG: response regulator [Planctomycetota bacterium]
MRAVQADEVVMERKDKILLVEPNPDLLEMLLEALTGRFDAHITCVDCPEACWEVDMGDPHDLVLTELELPRGNGLRLAGELVKMTSPERPVVLLSDKIPARRVIRAMRLGLRDVFIKPFAMEKLLDRIEVLLREFSLRRRHVSKYHGMRELVRRVIRERRDVHRRTELVCRDLVGAHKRLVHRVLEFEGTQTQTS